MSEQSDIENWHARWRDGRIGFHQASVNKLLMKHWPTVCDDPDAEVFVPLCGKSLDMIWLAERGHDVIGVELSDIAIDAFFSENALSRQMRQDGPFTISETRIGENGGSVEIWCGDFFAFSKDRLKMTSAAYDRASLIALPTDLRRRYAQTLCDLLPANARTLLQVIAYDQSLMNGPPFSVTDAEVTELFKERLAIEHRETRDAAKGSTNLTERGLNLITTSIFVLGPALERSRS